MKSLRQLSAGLLLGCLCLATSACAPSLSSAPSAGAAARVLIVGGGSSHDFTRWFNQADSATLAEAGARVSYTDVPGEILPALAEVDVLYLSNNQPLTDPQLREGIFNLVAAGKGLIIGHAAAWYNWADWPAYNRDLVGGGARGHQRYGEFTVEVVAPEHPIMQGVPASFTLKDELYQFIPDTAGSAMTVLATAKEAETGRVFPIVWTVQNSNGRIVVNTLGHDAESHDLPAYERILQNSLRWVSGR